MFSLAGKMPWGRGGVLKPGGGVRALCGMGDQNLEMMLVLGMESGCAIETDYVKVEY